MNKTVTVGDKELKLKTSAALMRLYKANFGRDIMKDIMALRGVDENTLFEGDNMETLENITYTMARHADPGIPDNILEWLEGFDTFSLMNVLPEVLNLWEEEVKTSSNAKKNIE